jgi:hypothetical protein
MQTAVIPPPCVQKNAGAETGAAKESNESLTVCYFGRNLLFCPDSDDIILLLYSECCGIEYCKYML